MHRIKDQWKQYHTCMHTKINTKEVLSDATIPHLIWIEALIVVSGEVVSMNFTLEQSETLIVQSTETHLNLSKPVEFNTNIDQ